MNEVAVIRHAERAVDFARRYQATTEDEMVAELCAQHSKEELARIVVRRAHAYKLAARRNMKPLAARIGAKLTYKRDTACWIWNGATNGAGYGMIGIGAKRKVYVHRATYEIARGPIPSGMVLDHLCRNPSCCSPAHLEAVTNRENTLRGKVSALRHLRKSA